MHLFNGESERAVDYADRGLHYGDGLFETIAVKNGTPLFLQQHFQRLQQGCKRLLLPAPDITVLKTEAAQLVRGSDTAVLKLIITRGTGARGYRQPEQIRPTRLFSLHPFPCYPASYAQAGIKVRYCTTRLGLNPGLAGIKHLNRLEQVMARAEWNNSDIQEGLMQDVNGNIIAGTSSNFFLIKDRILYTPSITNCGVNGILRRVIIALAKQNDIPVMVKNISKQEVAAADELLLSNSIIGIWPIKQLAGQRYPKGEISSKLQTWLAALPVGSSDAD